VEPILFDTTPGVNRVPPRLVENVTPFRKDNGLPGKMHDSYCRECHISPVPGLHMRNKPRTVMPFPIQTVGIEEDGVRDIVSPREGR
jgi:hypothetical protein